MKASVAKKSEGAKGQSQFDLKSVQAAIKEEELDGWLFYFFHDNDPLSLSILKLEGGHFTRRWFYFVPKAGEPVKIVHRIEMDALDFLPGEKRVYLGWKQLESVLKETLGGVKEVAMQYSPMNHIPYVARVDSGIVELVRSAGAEVCTSANLVQKFEAVWNDEQLKSHVIAAENLRKFIFAAFRFIKERINTGKSVNEYEVQQFICKLYEEHGMITSSPPIVAVNSHSGLPHYQPNKDSYSEITKGDFVLLDIWAKQDTPHNAIYADITWTGFVGDVVPQKYVDIFEVVRGARDAALAYVSERIGSKNVVHGYQVDDVSRNYITERGYGDRFVHRTGHSICTEVHANGANIDNLETKDEREIIAHTGFSIEPGVYLEEFGVRSEIDAYVGDNEVLVFGQPIQTEIIPILGLE
ncbi:MAG: aminopeptidase P family protein [Candidatus Melainabacteria bacterium]|nr:aminopeptidase P family protein [Candidatus Melainabacteria bacterium]